MSIGGKGVIFVVANEIPRDMSSLVKAAIEGDFNLAREYQRFLLPLMDINFIESNPIPVKQALASLGLCEPVWRLPLVAPSAENKSKIEMILKEMKLL